jgi:hypothetical protein
VSSLYQPHEDRDETRWFTISIFGWLRAPWHPDLARKWSRRLGVNPDNECWDAKGLYVTDGAAFPTQGIQHPTLTIMALTARACAHAVRLLPLAAASLMRPELIAPLTA